MIKFVIVLVFGLWLLWLRPTYVGDNLVSLELFPFTPSQRLPLDAVVFGAAMVGLLVASLLGLIDQWNMKRVNGRLRKENGRLDEELKNLRGIVTEDRISE